MDTLKLYGALLILVSLALALTILYPKAVLLTVAIIVTVATVSVVRARRRTSGMPPSPPPRCMQCGSEQLDVLSSGLWDGFDADGRETGGGMMYAVCKLCGERFAQYTEGEGYIPSNEEWQRHFQTFQLSNELREQQARWPFVSKAESDRNANDSVSGDQPKAESL